MFLGDIDENRGIYMVGIGGVSMSALGKLLHARGISVRGSDAQESNFTRALREQGVPVHIGSDELITEDDVVYTGAVDEGHPQIKAAKEAGKRLLSRPELLGRIAEGYPHVLSVAGCHGKTTTTCMLSHIFHANNRRFTSHIGGEDLLLGNVCVAGHDYFITEACEFKRSFLSLHSNIAVILNCDRDHTDCYKTDAELMKAYRTFAAQSKSVVVNADDTRARKLPHSLDFGMYAGRIRAEKLRAQGEKYSFIVTDGGMPVVRIKLNVVGRVHVYNALAAYAAASLCGFTGEEIKRGIESFTGVKRRFENIGTFRGVPVICDYAHHPREISATISTAERLCGGTVRLVFQPHTYTRTRDFMREFVTVLHRTDAPIVYATYSAREAYDFEGSAARLAGLISDGRYVQSPEQLETRLSEHLERDDLILVLGAGDIYDVAKGLLDS